MNKIGRYKVDGPSKQKLLNEALKTVVLLLSPIVPHVCEELWQMMGGKEKSVIHIPWPSYDEAILETETVELVVQINGKLRGKFRVPSDIEEEALKQLITADGKIQQYVAGQTIKKYIVVPKKLVNIVI